MSTSTALALPDPATVTLLAVTETVVPRAAALRELARETKSLAGAEELRRQLLAFEKYVRGKEAHDQVAAESRRTEILIGHLLGPGAHAQSADGRFAISLASEMATIAEDDRYRFRLLARYEPRVEEWLGEGLVSRSAILGKIQRLEDRPDGPDEAPALTLASWQEWLPGQGDCDLLLTDPPYMTDLDAGDCIEGFAARWLPAALSRVKATGRAYVCIGAYPRELAAYLAVATPGFTLANVLAWHYRNTLGPAPRLDYKQTWQAILHYRGAAALPLDSPTMTEQFDVWDIAAPDGRRGERDHAWQKPDELGLRAVRHATAPGALVLDPFAGTGTFLLAAARLGRVARGCERDPQMVAIAQERGCDVG